MDLPQTLTAYLGLGSNIGTDEEKLAMLASAVRTLAEQSGSRLRVTGASSVYRTPPWGETDQPDFYNAVIRVATTLSPRELLTLVKSAERLLGRTPTYRWGPRLIDIDVLLMEGIAVKEEGMEIPHPRLLERAFVVVPLLDLEPEAKLPDGRRVADAAQVSEEGMTRVGKLPDGA